MKTMKSNILFFGVITLMSVTHAGRLLAPEAVKITQIAIQLTEQDIAKHESSGRVSCQYIMAPLMQSSTIFSANGKDMATASVLAQVKCIREACRILPGAVDQEAKRLAQDKELLRALMRAQNIPEAEIEAVLKLSSPERRGDLLQCQSNFNLALTAETFCTAAPISCGEN